MPEQLTPHPEVTLQVLRSAGARCGEGAPQDILKQCPAPRFCKLPGGEMCIYGLEDAARMTQVSAQQWRSVLPAAPSPPWLGSALAGAIAGLVAGVVLTAIAMRWRARGRS